MGSPTTTLLVSAMLLWLGGCGCAPQGKATAGCHARLLSDDVRPKVIKAIETKEWEGYTKKEMEKVLHGMGLCGFEYGPAYEPFFGSGYDESIIIGDGTWDLHILFKDGRVAGYMILTDS